MPRNLRVDAVVVGAGLSGLACSADLCAAGLDVMLLEACHRVGGRMVSDHRDGFLLDRGFQVFNTAYPQVRRRMNLSALHLRAFDAGYVLVRGDRRTLVADPTRQIGAAPGMLRIGGPRDLLALAALSARDMLAPAALVRHSPRMPTLQTLQRAGLSDGFIDTVLVPFLRGVFLEHELATSGRFFHLVWRSMLRGTLCLPEGGIGQVPRQLADALPMGTLRLSSPVERIGEDGVTLDGGQKVSARTIVIATGPTAARQLLPRLPHLAARAVTTVYHAAPEAPWPDKKLLVDGDGLLLNTSVVSNIQPAYAPAGAALMSTSLLGLATEEQILATERRLPAIYGTSTRRWERLAVHRIREALPALPPSQLLIRSTRLAPGLYVCGDHRATASVQGALASGSRAARDVLRDRTGPQTVRAGDPQMGPSTGPSAIGASTSADPVRRRF